jgi:hypothetical protein
MVERHEFHNSYLAETAVNTLKYASVEVPGSSGASKVYIVRAEVDVSMPDYVAASNTAVEGAIIAGAVVPTIVGIQQVGAITTKKCMIMSTGAAGFAALIQGPDQAQGRFEVPKNAADGKFYFTAAVISTLCTNLHQVNWRVDFLIES